MISKATYYEVGVLLNNGVHNHVKTVEITSIGDSERAIYASMYEEKYISVIDDTISGIFTTLADAQQWLESVE